MDSTKKKTMKKEEIQSLKEINDRIYKEVCNETINKLSDMNLIDEYKKSKSVKNKITNLKKVLKKHDIQTNKQDEIVDDYILELIPPGTKGVIRGNKFNKIVNNAINNLELDEERFKICFEEMCEMCETSERPDWYILEKTSNKVIIGMNQLDLINGGQQTNRGSKYLIDNKHNTNKSKLLCVICNYVEFKTQSKKTKLFQIGFENDTLCYLNNLENIIKKYFD